MVSSVVLVGMAIPAAFPQNISPTLFGEVNPEVVHFEPANSQICTTNPTREVTVVVFGNGCVRGVCRRCVGVLDTCTRVEVCRDLIEDLHIDRSTAD